MTMNAVKAKYGRVAGGVGVDLRKLGLEKPWNTHNIGLQ
jgi:predicted sugar kinase